MGILLLWRPRSSFKAAKSVRTIVESARRARFSPKYPDWVPNELTQAIGQVVTVSFAGIAPEDGPFPGQRLFREWQRNDLLNGYPIPARDLEFLDADSAAV